MKASEIEIGGVYMIGHRDATDAAKLGGTPGDLVPVKVVGTFKSDWHKQPHTVYDCIALLTRSRVRVSSVLRFRRAARSRDFERLGIKRRNEP